MELPQYFWSWFGVMVTGLILLIISLVLFETKVTQDKKGITTVGIVSFVFSSIVIVLGGGMIGYGFHKQMTPAII